MSKTVSFHTLKDWLKLHDISTKDCANILKKANAKNISGALHSTLEMESGFDESTALAFLKQVFVARLPSGASTISSMFEVVNIVYPESTPPPFKPNTDLIDPNGISRIESYRPTTVRGMIALTHELGHAMHFAAQKDSFINPISREICAFTAEFCLIQVLRKMQSPLHERYLKAWEAENFLYLTHYGDALQNALPNKQEAYNYGWNYPIARFVSYRNFKRDANYDLWEQYKGNCSLKDWVKFSLSKESDVGLGAQLGSNAA